LKTVRNTIYFNFSGSPKIPRGGFDWYGNFIGVRRHNEFITVFKGISADVGISCILINFLSEPRKTTFASLEMASFSPPLVPPRDDLAMNGVDSGGPAYAGSSLHHDTYENQRFLPPALCSAFFTCDYSHTRFRDRTRAVTLRSMASSAST